ncbi:unnamed protein product [Adineta steineri]|uniref:RING-type domain-containing protein n=1 Tax=Adineta steineri TaxID=433720 RepID=A0A815Y9N3_9BILA|nr:unnamed protein product [Adineta steineri]CAF1290652.1 unnamed protein product [Adineta steineri]CAF1567781.1 unnamed protein product [Adineta steineri]CAF1568679.1 unnamed protein product [Adineta steineri]
MDKIIIESSLVNSLFKCPLCNELIHSATVINECLHRFCKLCITNYFQNSNNNTCPLCQMMVINPLETLSSLDLFPNESPIELSKCYLECPANTPLLSIEKFLRIKYSLLSTIKIDLFYKTFLLNTDKERLNDICYCFDIRNKTLDIRFVISPYGYQAILQRIHQSKQPSPLKIEILAPTISSSLSSTGSIDSTLKVKLCRSQSSTNDWYIPQSIELPDLINSCENRTKYKKSLLKKKFNKPRRRIRFIPTMVKVPPSIFDCLSNNRYDFNTFQSNEKMINTVSNTKSMISITKTICKVSPYIRESSSSIIESSFLEKSSLFNNTPLDLSLK